MRDTIDVLPRIHMGDPAAYHYASRLHRDELAGIAAQLTAAGEQWPAEAERHAELGRAAAEVQSQVLSGRVAILTADRVAARLDRYGRALAYVSTAGIPDVALFLLERGVASAWFPAGTAAPERSDGYAAAARQARLDRVGAWRECDQLGRMGR